MLAERHIAELERKIADLQRMRDSHEVRDQAEAIARRMTGSPTLLVDGADPFAVAGQAPSLSCRLYVDEAGGLSGAPTLDQLRAALATGADR